MSQFLVDGGSADDALYDLYAVSNHFGGLGGGHYTAYCKNPIDEKWYDCDDSRVSPLRGKVMTSAAYLLFYKQRSSPPVDLVQACQDAYYQVKEEAVKVEEAKPSNPATPTESDEDLVSSSPKKMPSNWNYSYPALPFREQNPNQSAGFGFGENNDSTTPPTAVSTPMDFSEIPGSLDLSVQDDSNHLMEPGK